MRRARSPPREGEGTGREGRGRAFSSVALSAAMASSRLPMRAKNSALVSSASRTSLSPWFTSASAILVKPTFPRPPLRYQAACQL